MGSCAALGCPNTSQKGFIMKRFPKNAAIRQQWVAQVKRPKWKPNDRSLLCEAHFEEDMWEKTNGTKKLKKDAIPTIFTPHTHESIKRKSQVSYEDYSDSENEDDESDSSDPSYIASGSDFEVSDDEALPRKTRSGAKIKLTVKKKEEKKTDKEQIVPQENVKQKLYNPYSKVKQHISPNNQPIHPDVRLSRLPFYDTLSELLKPSMLQPQLMQQTVHEKSFYFYLTPQQTRDIINSRIVKQDGSIEFEKQVQMRFCLAETICKQKDYFPPNLMVKINQRLYPLPAFIPSNKPDQEPKRPSQPLNITPFIKLSATISNTITVFWTIDHNSGYVISVELVQKLTSQDLLERLKKKGAMHSDHTRGLIKEKLTEEDTEIITTHLRVSLMCPLGKMRMVHPCRATTCLHLQCFDSSLYLQMNERKPTWHCPVCDKPALYENLVIDGYFQSVLSSPILPSSVNEIELNKDGSWNIQNSTIKSDALNNAIVDEAIEIIGDDSESPPLAQVNSGKITDVIVIDSDEEQTNFESLKMSDVVINLDSSSNSSTSGSSSNNNNNGSDSSQSENEEDISTNVETVFNDKVSEEIPSDIVTTTSDDLLLNKSDDFLQTVINEAVESSDQNHVTQFVDSTYLNI